MPPASVPALALCVILALVSPGVTEGASPPPSASPPPHVNVVDLSGHWASPVSGSGIDLVQAGSQLRGSALSGLRINGTISGLHATFTFWYGQSYATTSELRRGHGTLDASPDGNSATVSWRDENPEGKDNGTFRIFRVVSPIGQPAPADDPALAMDDTVTSDALVALMAGYEVAFDLVGILAAAQAAALDLAVVAAAAQADTVFAGDSEYAVALAETEQLQLVAARLKEAHEEADRVATLARQASAKANEALRQAENNITGTYQDMLIAESFLKNAEAAVVSATLEADEAKATQDRALTAQADAQAAVASAESREAQASLACLDAERQLAAAGQGATDAMRVTRDRAVAALQAAATAHEAAVEKLDAIDQIVQANEVTYQQLRLDVKDRTDVAALGRISRDKAVAAIPIAAADLQRAKLDAGNKAGLATDLSASAWQAYVYYDKAYWAAWTAMQKLVGMPADAR